MWVCVVVILIWSKFFDYRLRSWEGDKFGDKTLLCQQWWRRHTVINHELRRRRGGPHPGLDLELLWGAMKNIICLNQRSEEGGRLTGQWEKPPTQYSNNLRFDQNTTVLQVMDKPRLSGEKFLRVPVWTDGLTQPAACLCAIKSENSSINRAKKEYKSQSFHAYWMYVCLKPVHDPGHNKFF